MNILIIKFLYYRNFTIFSIFFIRFHLMNLKKTDFYFFFLFRRVKLLYLKIEIKNRFFRIVKKSIFKLSFSFEYKNLFNLTKRFSIFISFNF